MKRNTAGVLLGLKENKTKIIFTGMSSIDSSMGGLRGGNTYVLAGLEKSGKTSLLLNWISYLLKEKKKVVFVSTEMSFDEVVSRLASIREVRISFDRTTEKLKLYSEIDEYLDFVGVDEIIEEGGLSVKKTAKLVEQKIWEGAEIAIVDNLTTFGTQQTTSEPTWAKIGVALTKLVNIAKTTNTPIIVVLHIKPNSSFKEKPEGIMSLVKSGKGLSIFDDSQTIIQKPSLVDVYGGGGALSQISGALLLWRPYQKFSLSTIRGESAIILDSMRHSESGIQIRVNYEGATGKFYEQMTGKESREYDELLKIDF